MDWEQFQQGAQASQTYDQWYQQALQQAQNAGGDAGWGPIRPDVYYNDTTYTLPGQQGSWMWDAGGNQYIQPEGGKWNPDGMNTVNVIHDDGTGNQDGTGVYTGQVQMDKTPHGWEKAVDTVMPYLVAAITAYAGGAAIGGAMGAGEGAAAGAAAGDGSTGAAAGASEAAPTFSYGTQAPAWSQAGGTELGTGLYGTDTASMAGTFGTTADAGTGLGSGLGSGVAADGGAWAGTGGGWQAMTAEAGGGTSLADMLKYGKNAYSAYNALTGTTAKPGTVGGSPSGVSLGNALSGGGSSAGGFGSSVQMPQQAQATTPLSMLTTPQFANPAAPAAKDATPDELNNSTNILRLAQALRGKTA